MPKQRDKSLAAENSVRHSLKKLPCHRTWRRGVFPASRIKRGRIQTSYFVNAFTISLCLLNKVFCISATRAVMARLVTVAPVI